MSTGLYKVKDRVNYSNGTTSFKQFKATYPETTLTAQDYTKIIRQSNDLIAEGILNNPYGFKLPNSLGYIAVDKFKPRKGSRIKPIDWITTNKTGKLTYLTNLHSFGFIYMIRLYRNPNKKNLDCYVFKAQKLLNRALAKKIKAGRDYDEIDRSFFTRRFSIDKIFKKNEII